MGKSRGVVAGECSLLAGGVMEIMDCLKQ